ncbi:MAG: serine hydrolase [Burkholderiaceae bacterium]|jgi:CubicO group peptidase (beta-lactamase class C family)
MLPATAWGRIAWVGLGVVVLAGIAYRPDRALEVATGTVAHDLCSETFVAHLDPQRIFEESLRPRRGLRIVAPAISWNVHFPDRTVDASILGAFSSRARFREGLGCVLEFGPGVMAPAIQSPPEGVNASAKDRVPALLAPIAPASSEVVEPQDARLRSALDAIFAEPPEGPRRWTTSVVVLLDGRIVAERYARGYGITTPILGFSMTKSVMSALVGILVQKGLLRVDARAPFAAWDSPSDPRNAITVEHLLRMDSGLDLDETGTGFDPSNRMLYDEPDMAAYAERARLIAAPATRWHYSSASTQLVARIVRDTIASTGDEVSAFARRELFEPLGMEHVTLETDGTGTPVGAHYMLASARDWARFGWLYACDGVLGGRRILPEGWVAFSAKPTLGTHYGAGFWLGGGGAQKPGQAVIPADALFASGNLGQRIAIIPSLHLVVVRTGHSHGRDFDNPAFVELVEAAIDAIRPVAAPHG